MNRASWLLLCPAALSAHMVSMSTGEVRIEGSRARYELRMPLYEIAHVRDPGQSLLAHIHFHSAGAEGRVLDAACRADAAEGAYLCAATYVFPAPVEQLEVECAFDAVTVPNHVHVLRAAKGDKTDQAIFDFSFRKAELNFEPPAGWSVALRQALAGMLRAIGGLAQMLFLASLALAARSRRELIGLTAAFLAGEVAGCLGAAMSGWQPVPAFVEAACALSIAYLAMEILLVPKAGGRWIVAGVLGVLHGLYFALFLNATGYRAANVLAGMAAAELAGVALFALLLSRLRQWFYALQPVKLSAGALFLTGLTWFFLRLRG